MEEYEILVPEFIIEEKPSITISDTIKLIDQYVFDTIESDIARI